MTFISKTHLNKAFDDTVVAIQGSNIYRKDRNASGGTVRIWITCVKDLIMYVISTVRYIF
jgi:hypothetical protein